MTALLGQLAAFLDSDRWLKLLLLVGGAMILLILVRVQRGKSAVDFRYMLLDDANKTSPTRILATGSWIAMTWWGCVLVNNNQFTEWFFNGYGLLWVGSRLGTKYLDQQHERQMRAGYSATATVTETTNIPPAAAVPPPPAPPSSSSG